MFVRDNPGLGKTMGVSTSLLGKMAYDQEKNHPHGVGNREEFTDVILLKGGVDATTETLVNGLEFHVGGGEGQVDGVSQLSVGHAVVDVRGAHSDDHRGLAHPGLVVGGILDAAAVFGFLDDHKPPGLAVLGRRRPSAGFKNSLQGLG